MNRSSWDKRLEWETVSRSEAGMSDRSNFWARCAAMDRFCSMCDCLCDLGVGVGCDDGSLSSFSSPSSSDGTSFNSVTTG